MIRLTKRRKFILCSLVLSLGLFSIQLGWISNRYLAIIFLSLLVIPLVLWSLKEALAGPIWFISWILPLLFTAGVGFFYFLLPSSLYTSIPVIIIFFLGMYSLFLSENIFSVAAIRTIQLYRSSMAVSFLLILVISFLLFDTVLSFRLPFFINGLSVFLISLFLFLHGCWVVNLDEKISKDTWRYSLILSLGIGEMASAISFWPVQLTLAAVFLTAFVYVSLGLVQAQLSDRLFKSTVREYIFVGIAVFLVLLFYTSWG